MGNLFNAAMFVWFSAQLHKASVRWSKKLGFHVDVKGTIETRRHLQGDEESYTQKGEDIHEMFVSVSGTFGQTTLTLKQSEIMEYINNPRKHFWRVMDNMIQDNLDNLVETGLKDSVDDLAQMIGKTQIILPTGGCAYSARISHFDKVEVITDLGDTVISYEEESNEEVEKDQALNQRVANLFLMIEGVIPFDKDYVENKEESNEESNEEVEEQSTSILLLEAPKVEEPTPQEIVEKVQETAKEIKVQKTDEELLEQGAWNLAYRYIWQAITMEKFNELESSYEESDGDKYDKLFEVAEQLINDGEDKETALTILKDLYDEVDVVELETGEIVDALTGEILTTEENQIQDVVELIEETGVESDEVEAAIESLIELEERQAETAIPTFIEPETVAIGNGELYDPLTGRITMANEHLDPFGSVDVRAQNYFTHAVECPF